MAAKVTTGSLQGLLREFRQIFCSRTHSLYIFRNFDRNFSTATSKKKYTRKSDEWKPWNKTQKNEISLQKPIDIFCFNSSRKSSRFFSRHPAEFPWKMFSCTQSLRSIRNSSIFFNLSIDFFFKKKKILTAFDFEIHKNKLKKEIPE